jgi:hypothetical protein
MEAVRILSMEDEMIMKFAARVPEKSLPRYPGGVAIEFVAIFEKLLGPCRFRKLRSSSQRAWVSRTEPDTARYAGRNKPKRRASNLAATPNDQIAIAA